jgi:TRAP-type mannitol/chloroaromatic compound transport system permease large subunit
MGLLALPQMLKGGYDIKISAGAITAGGCLGILIPPSVMLIVYGATAGVSVVQLYAGAFFPGLMLAGLYIVYVIVLAKIKPHLMPPLSAEQRFVPLTAPMQTLSASVSNFALPALLKGTFSGVAGVPTAVARRQLGVSLLPLLVFGAAAFTAWHLNTRPVEAPLAAPATLDSGAAEPDAANSGGLQEPPSDAGGLKEPKADDGGLKEPPASDAGLKEPPSADAGVKEPPSADAGVKEPPGAVSSAGKESAAGVQEPPAAAKSAGTAPAAKAERTPATRGWWIGLGVGALAMIGFYALLSFQRLEIFKMLLGSFFPLVVLILAVLGSIVLGLATPTEAAAVGAFGGYLLASIYAVIGGRGGADPARRKGIFGLWLVLWLPAITAITWFILHDEGFFEVPAVPMLLGTVAAVGIALWVLMAYRQAGLKTEVKESVFLTAKTSAMVCGLFVGSAIFSAAFALLGGQELVERWVLSMNLTKTQFLVLSQVIIFILGWPLEWTEIIVIFMPIFIPLLDKFGVDPLFFGLLVALNLQTAFLSPPVAMAAFYLKGVSPPHVTLNQIFAGMLPFMGIQVLAIILLYQFPAIGLWLPQVLYK